MAAYKQFDFAFRNVQGISPAQVRLLGKVFSLEGDPVTASRLTR